MEADLRNDPEFEQVLPEDKEALKIFRKAGDFGAFVVEEDYQTVESFGDPDDSVLAERPSTATSKRSRLSIGSSVSSIRSKLSQRSSLLPPLYEEADGSEDGEDSPNENMSASTAKTHDTIIEEASGEGSDSD